MTRTRVVFKSGRKSAMFFTNHRSICDRQIKIDSIFTSYRIQSNAANVITVALSSEALLAALKSASSSSSSSGSSTDEVVVKLAKKNDQAVLSFEISGTSRLGKGVRVSHDVKIEVMKPSDVERLNEPLCPEPDVSVMGTCGFFNITIMDSL